jgi:hypothetical protein
LNRGGGFSIGGRRVIAIGHVSLFT